jgi:hypothetical protein
MKDSVFLINRPLALLARQTHTLCLRDLLDVARNRPVAAKMKIAGRNDPLFCL